MLRAFDRALATERSPAGKQVLTDPEAQRRDGADASGSRTARTRLRRLLRGARAGRARHRRRADRRDQRGREPGLHGGLPPRVDRAVAVRPREHGRQHAGRHPPGRRAGRDAPDHGHGEGRRLREPLEVHDADAGRRPRGREGLHHRVRQDGRPGRVPAADPRRRRRRHVREGRASCPSARCSARWARRTPTRSSTRSRRSCSTAPTGSASGPRATAATRPRSASTS